jgi:3-deoxy-D-manno-octulosonic-acid transferase
MARSLGLTLYNLRPRRDGGVQAERPPRPPGRVVWLHAPSAQALRSLSELARRLADEDGLPVLLTLSDPALSPQAAQPGVLVDPAPDDVPGAVRSFLDHWRPDIAIFSDGELRPALVAEAQERGIPLLMVDAREPHLLPGRDGWFPGLMRSVLSAFGRVLAVDEASARAFRKAGAALSAVAVTGRMEERSAALPCLEAERAALARLLATRPVWFAASLPEAEEVAIILAHRSALRLAHRMLLILAPEDPARLAPLAAQMTAEEGWVVASRVADEEPDPEVEVYLVDTAEIGLWYRLAPITYLGGSLTQSGCLRDPMEAAALGSAILHGPRPGPHGAAIGRLGAARAARAVATATDLADALADLMAPDRAARLAQAAWAVASDGAEVTEDVMSAIRGLLDGQV